MASSGPRAGRSRSDRFLPPDPRVEGPYRFTPQLALRIAIFGAVALGVHNNTLERQAATQPLSAQARDAIAGARGKFAAELTTLQVEERKTAEIIVRQSLGASISLVMGLAAALAFAAALCAALTMRPPQKQTQAATKPAGV